MPTSPTSDRNAKTLACRSDVARADAEAKMFVVAPPDPECSDDGGSEKHGVDG
ncbi:MAG: hypothetical protein OXN44_02685 [Acidimicrobiaceae bacterium]|nr:hypothetical protein [Acidimicrobiaceae bacterium]